MTNSRRKGSAGELELARAIHDELGIKLLRQLDQPRSGGHDLIVDPDEDGPVAASLRRYALECKRHSRLTPSLVRGWWQQTEHQAATVGLTPALCYRPDRADWRVIIPLAAVQPGLTTAQGLTWTAELSLPGFCCVVREG